MKAFLKRARALQDTLIADRRHLHAIPEIGHDLPQTVSYVKKRLAEIGYQPQEIGNSGLVVTAGGKNSGKTFLLRADMDALPLREESGLPFAATNGNCHACGHDLNTTSLLGAAILLKQMEQEIQGTVKLLFQPAEETFSGAKSMIDAGIMTAPPVSAAFGIHVASEYPLGGFGYSMAEQFASCDTFQIDIQGKGCHGANPHLGVDPVNVAVHIHLSAQEILSREVSAQETLVLTFGQLAGGQATNIIPDTAQMKGTIRAYSPAVRTMAVQRLEEISAGVAATFRATAKVTWLASVPSLIADKSTVEFALDVLRSAEIEKTVFNVRKSMGSEDFACISSLVPSAFIFVGAKNPDASECVNLHNPRVVFDENCLPIGAAVYATIATRWLAQNK